MLPSNIEDDLRRKSINYIAFGIVVGIAFGAGIGDELFNLTGPGVVIGVLTGLPLGIAFEYRYRMYLKDYIRFIHKSIKK